MRPVLVTFVPKSQPRKGCQLLCLFWSAPATLTLFSFGMYFRRPRPRNVQSICFSSASQGARHHCLGLIRIFRFVSLIPARSWLVGRSPTTESALALQGDRLPRPSGRFAADAGFGANPKYRKENEQRRYCFCRTSRTSLAHKSLSCCSHSQFWLCWQSWSRPIPKDPSFTLLCTPDTCQDACFACRHLSLCLYHTKNIPSPQEAVTELAGAAERFESSKLKMYRGLSPSDFIAPEPSSAW